jgi:hypothetical protein
MSMSSVFHMRRPLLCTISAALFRLLDFKVRRSLRYRAALVAGLARALPSDSIVEQVLKRWPLLYGDFVSDCVHGDWEHCLGLLLAQEAHDRRRGPWAQRLLPSAVAAPGLALEAVGAERAARRAQAAAQAAGAAADTGQQAYRNSRTAPSLSPAEKEELQEKARELRKAADAAAQAAAAARRRADALEARQEAIRGPRGMDKRVRDVRRHGWSVRNALVAATYASPLLAPSSPATASDAQAPAASLGLALGLAVKPGQFVRVGDSPVVYKVIPNNGDLG